MSEPTTDTSAKTRGRKPRFDRPATVDSIADLFWSRGYDGVALSDVMAATGLSKSSLYNSFGDKDDLFRIALSHYHEGVVEAGADWLRADDGQDPWEKLDTLLSGPADDSFGDASDKRGCFLCNTAADGPTEPAIDALVGEGFEQLTQGVSALLRRAAPDAPGPKIDALATTLVTAYAGLRVRSRHTETRDTLDTAKATLMQLARLALVRDAH